MSHGQELRLYTACDHFFGKILAMSGMKGIYIYPIVLLICISLFQISCYVINSNLETRRLVKIVFKSDIIDV